MRSKLPWLWLLLLGVGILAVVVVTILVILNWLFHADISIGVP